MENSVKSKLLVWQAKGKACILKDKVNYIKVGLMRLIALL